MCKNQKHEFKYQPTIAHYLFINKNQLNYNKKWTLHGEWYYRILDLH
jgi:hypothetical protein